MNKYKDKAPVKYACLLIKAENPEYIQEVFETDIHFLDKWRKYES